MINWDVTPTAGTSFRQYFESPWPFEETVARLLTLSQQPIVSPDEYKVSVEFVGTYQGEPFTLYDDKGDRELHIGGFGGLDLVGLQSELRVQLNAVTPTPYRAHEYYDDCTGQVHAWEK